MTLVNDVIGVGLTLGMTLFPPTYLTPKIEVTLAENGKVVVLRQTEAERNTRERHSGRHPIHAPTTRLVSGSTDVSSVWSVVAMPDLDHVKDAVSDRIIEDTRAVVMAGRAVPTYFRTA